MNGRRVVEAVDLTNFEKVSPEGGAYDTLEITVYKKSVKIKLPKIVTENLADDQLLDIRINKPGNIIVLLPATGAGFKLTILKHTASIYSARLARMLEAREVMLPARYYVVADAKIDGWVCRKEESDR